jgi:hypothetical protein
LIDEKRASRALALRASLGLAVPAPAPTKAAAPARKPKAARVDRPAEATSKAGSATGDATPVANPGVPARMPKPAFVRPPPAAPPPAARRFRHPKFGEGVLESQSGTGPDAKFTIKFEDGSKTLLARFVTEVT